MATLDHIIILVPHPLLTSLPTPLSSNFTISPGGRHADNLTENRLIILPDGVYIELIAFLPHVNPDQRASHWWGDLPYGVIDFALTSPDVRDVERVRSVLAAQTARITYAPPRRGGRKRGDGAEVKWEVTFPRLSERLDRVASDRTELRRGGVPFWCHDVTDRGLRVPVSNSQCTSHTCGATGVREVILGIPRAELKSFNSIYAAVVGSERNDDQSFALKTPFGKPSAIKLQPFDETEARIISLVISTDQETKDLQETLGGGNEVRLQIVK